jgi:hypothetical protein
VPADFEENTWATLKDAIEAIFMKKPTLYMREDLYQVLFLKFEIYVNRISER